MSVRAKGDDNVKQKVLQYEAFIDEVLKRDLK